MDFVGNIFTSVGLGDQFIGGKICVID